jgi:signal peptidase I
LEPAASRPSPSAFAGRRAGAGTAARPDLSRAVAKPGPTGTEAEADDDDRSGDGSGGWRRFLIRSFIIIVIAGIAAILLRTFVVQPYYIPSESMEPTLHGCSGCTDDHVLVDKISYRAHGPRVRDIVVFDRPKDANVPDKVLIKRVIALGGDTIAMRAGTVFVNGQRIAEPYLNADHSCYPTSNFATRKVKPGFVFVMGDNRCNSTDSRVFGAISTDLIIGRAFMIIWPFGHIGFLH